MYFPSAFLCQQRTFLESNEFALSRQTQINQVYVDNQVWCMYILYLQGFKNPTAQGICSFWKTIAIYETFLPIKLPGKY